jgi:hypothetical protein
MQILRYRWPITADAEVSIAGSWLTIFAIARSTELAQEFPSVLSSHESEAVRGRSLNQGTTSVVPHMPQNQCGR